MAKVAFEDLSGTSTPLSGNPYDGLINACHDDAVRILLSPLFNLSNDVLETDPRTVYRASADEKRATTRQDSRRRFHRLDTRRVPCQSRWATKRRGIRRSSTLSCFLGKTATESQNVDRCYSGEAQRRCTRYAIRVLGVHTAHKSDLWLMPIDNLHMTVMEVAHSKTEGEIAALMDALKAHCQEIADHTQTHRARLIKPLLSYDAAALALSFVPAAGESLSHGRSAEDDNYTYHHLRRDTFAALTEAGIEVASRYVVPSAHLTIARFNTPNVFGGDPLDGSVALNLEKRKHWVKEIEMINKWLEAEYWPEDGELMKPGGEWTVGEEKGLDFRNGRLWYGGGQTIYLGQGFVHGEV